MVYPLRGSLIVNIYSITILFFRNREVSCEKSFGDPSVNVYIGLLKIPLLQNGRASRLVTGFKLSQSNHSAFMPTHSPYFFFRNNELPQQMSFPEAMIAILSPR